MYQLFTKLERDGQKVARLKFKPGGDYNIYFHHGMPTGKANDRGALLIIIDIDPHVAEMILLKDHAIRKQAMKFDIVFSGELGKKGRPIMVDGRLDARKIMDLETAAGGS